MNGRSSRCTIVHNSSQALQLPHKQDIMAIMEHNCSLLHSWWPPYPLNERWRADDQKTKDNLVINHSPKKCKRVSLSYCDGSSLINSLTRTVDGAPIETEHFLCRWSEQEDRWESRINGIYSIFSDVFIWSPTWPRLIRDLFKTCPLFFKDANCFLVYFLPSGSLKPVWESRNRY